jgi:sodium-coupled neutral amino acid transporter 9
MSILENLEDSKQISFITSATQQKPRSSYEVIFNVANTMMGTALLVMPCNFYMSGMITSILAAAVMMFISYWTCNLIIIHSRDDEYDYPLAIRRLLGPTWEKIFNFISFLLLLLVSIIHFILMANVLYSIIINISGEDGWPGFTDITFKSFSMQWVGVILFFLCGGLYSLNSIRKILIINDKGVYMVLLFSLYVMYLGVAALARTDIEFVATGEPGKANQGLQIVLFDADLSQLIGVFSLAYMVHNAVTGMMKNSKDPLKNSRNLLVAYLIVFSKYCILGIFGSFAVAALYNSEYDSKNPPKNIMELLTKKGGFLLGFERVLGMISLFFVFVQLTTVLPILNFFTKRQFYGLILGTKVENISKFQMHLFNIVFNLICLAFEIPVFEPIIVISYTGAIGGFLLIYIIPIYCHLTCLYFKKENVKQIDEALISKNNGIKSDGEDNYDDNKVDDSLNDSKESKVKLFGLDDKKMNKLISDEIEECRTDHTHEMTYSKPVVYTFYILLALYGLFILIISIYSNFKPKPEE